MDLTHLILTDREAFPDDKTIDFGNGQVVTVKQFRDAYLPKSEMTRMSEGWRAKERQLTEAYSGSQQQLQMMQQQLEQAARARGVDPAPRGEAVDEEELARDPILGPMFRKMQAAEKRANEAHAGLEELRAQHGKRLQQHEETWTRANYQNQLSHVFSLPEAKGIDRDAFLTYAQRRPVIDTENNGVDLTATFRNFAFDTIVAGREKAAEERGVERGKAAANVPRIPIGRRRAPSRPEGLPANIQSVDVDTVMNDPEMQEAMRADGLA